MYSLRKTYCLTFAAKDDDESILIFPLRKLIAFTRKSSVMGRPKLAEATGVEARMTSDQLMLYLALVLSKES